MKVLRERHGVRDQAQRGELEMRSRSAAVAYMKDLVTDPRHGYSQYHRDGPDYDCSSSVCEAYGLPHGTTSSIPNLFKAQGCKVYNWDGNKNDLEPGDLIGTKGKHVVMYIGGGKIAEFRIDESGGIAGSKQGDQTGTESWIRDFYVPSYGWEYVVSPPSDAGKLNPKYKVYTSEDGWLDWVTALEDYAGIRGHAIKGLAIRANDGHHIDYACHIKGGDWLETVNSDDVDTDDFERGFAGDLSHEIDAVKCYAHNDSKSGERAAYRVSSLNQDYYDWQYDYEISGGQDGYAGSFGKAIDRFQLY